ncbi:MAG: pirin family protein [Saprospiraceae bacterium]|nr:pirin family protein [Saprospiraceae bacterium]MCF8250598.1 pirin family protein [Saprospiraceae bacterium]MCF8281414.1 pirin family protein [Bacteroidales bacterium]MCF8313083.1 pirin family protein [Saprospiraceae bacterium]MCF8441553.1 pirin family protein [Saprospiraceae bacterium]
MSNTKSIQQVLASPAPHMVGDGFRVHNFFPSGYEMGMLRMSPFFLLDYGSKIDFPPTDTPRGVGVHPHRGFETVTIAFQGKVAHHDSTGNSGIIGEGDVQWMTAGSGILHKEYHEEEYSKKGGPFQMIQLWVNLPAKDKMTPPKYQAIENSQMGKYQLPNDGGVLEVIAGEYNGVKGPATTFTPIHAYVGRLKPGASLDISLPENFNTGILVVEGSLRINETEDVATDHFVVFQNDGTDLKVETDSGGIFLLLSGEPINENLVPYGPFLMNTRQEIMQAFEDLNAGKFGVLED